MRLEGKVAIITGAAAGIGRASALCFADRGAEVVVADLDEVGAESAAREIVEAGGKAWPLVVDVTSVASTERMAADTVKRYGRIDVLYANAGVGGSGTAWGTDLEDWERVLRVNLTGVWLSAKAALPTMLERRSGAIIAQASVAGLVGFRRTAAYSASKGGVIALVRQMAIDVAPAGVRVNAICPGIVPTNLAMGELPEDPEEAELAAQDLMARYVRRVPLKRVGDPRDIAGLAAFLASDEASWITGAVYPVDGGMSAV